MAYISKEEKNVKAVLLRALGKKHGVKLTVARDHYSTIVLNIASGKIDFFKDFQLKDDYENLTYLNVNKYYIKDHFTGSSKEFLLAAHAILNDGNHNKSDIMTDYFDVGFYIDIRIGRYNKPYLLTT